MDVKGGSTPKHRWTEEEKDFVRVHYKGSRLSARWIAEQLNVPEFGVKGQVQKLGLAMQKSPPWTKEELALLAELVHQYSVITIARRLHRSENAVKIKATRLKMKLRIRYGWYTKKDCCEILGVDRHKMQEWIDDGKLKATYHTGRKPQKDGMAMWHINIEDLRRFILRNADILQGRNVDIQQIVGIVAAGVERPAVLATKPKGKCPRCGGDLIKERTLEGTELSCLSCGFHPLGTTLILETIKEDSNANGRGRSDSAD